MFRMPAQKIAAGFVNSFESCPAMQHEHGVDCNPAHQSYAIGSCAAAMNPTPATVEKYFNCVKGCQVNMLNGNFCGGATPKCMAVVLAGMPDISGECEGNPVLRRARGSKRDFQSQRRSLRRRRPRREVRRLGAKTQDIPHGSGRDLGRG